VNRTVVPSCTGVPACSITVACTCVEPPIGSTVVPALTVSVEFTGAVNGTLSQLTQTAAANKRAM